MMRRYGLALFVTASLGVLGAALYKAGTVGIIETVSFLPDRRKAEEPARVTSPFHYAFSVDGTLHETGSMDLSSSPYFWLNSGGILALSDGTGKTAQGEIPEYSKWRLLYAAANAVDTDRGFHPENLLRLVTRSKWQNFRQEIHFRIARLNLSESPNRNASNGVLLMSRYLDGMNLYYAGLRVDGSAVIKKKIQGIYYTMAQKDFYRDHDDYDRETAPNFIPLQKWIGLRSEITTEPDGSVRIKVFVDKDNNGNWTQAAEAVDNNASYGASAILDAGFAGIRTDFMDVEFDNYYFLNL